MSKLIMGHCMSKDDCISKDNIENHFELVIVASKRARQISNGAPVDYTNESADIDKTDKAGVIALKEIANDMVEINPLKEDLIKGYRRIADIEESEEFEEENIEFDSFDDPEVLEAASEKEEVKEDTLSILDEIADSIEK